MIKDVLYQSKVLDGLFTEKDFSFLNEADAEITELDEFLRKQKINREHIINFINNFETTSNILNDTKLEMAQEAFILLNSNINYIYNLQEQFQQLEKSILEFIVDLENGNHSAMERIGEIKSKINSYSDLYKDIKKQILFNNSKIDVFLTQLHIQPETAIASDEIVINLDNTNSAKNLDNSIENCFTLTISENRKKVFLPYTQEEVLAFLKKYPNEYSSAKEVIEQEFVVPISVYSKHPKLARFREGYSLIRDREMKTMIDAFKFAIDLMFKYELHPAIIAACKSEKQLNDYLECLEANKLDDFKHFEIKFEVSPFAVKKYAQQM